MASFQTLLGQVSTPTTGSATLYPTTVSKNSFQVNPDPSSGFTGTVLIEGSSVPTPGANDWVTLATIALSAHTTNFTFDLYNNVPWMRAKVSAATTGAVSVYSYV